MLPSGPRPRPELHRERFETMRSTGVVFLLLIGLGTATSPANLVQLAGEEHDAIDPKEILATARFLASDELGGREAGSEGGRIATMYIASRFEALGLEPLGKDGGYFQALEKGRNVVGRIPGSDPDRAKEAIVIGAHLDHLGRGAKGAFNGADDNASGIATLLAVAKAIAKGPTPDRSIIFAAFDGEEKGLRGSRKYCQEPPVPLEETVLMVNLDMVGRDFAGFFPAFLFAIGTEHSAELREAIQKANDDGPRFRLLLFSASLLDRFWASSDHLPFWEAKVPFLYLTTGTHRDYHRVTDDADRLKPEKMAKIARLATEVVRSMAGTEERPAYRDVEEILGAEDRDGVQAILGPMIKMGPMMGIEPKAIARLGEILLLVEDADHAWTGDEVDALSTELRSMLKEMGLAP